MILHGNSILCLGPTNSLRIGVAKLIQHRVFEILIIFFISVSSVLLALDNPLNDPNGALTQLLFYSDIVLTSIFSLESVLQIVAKGLIFNGNGSYLRNGWNLIDFTIVTFSIVSLSFTGLNFKIIKIFRLIRVMRPLRLITRNPLLKIAIHALL